MHAHIHIYIYTYVFIKKRKKIIFFCISNLTTKRRIEISPNVIQTVWFNSKQRYTRMWKGSTFEGNERRRLWQYRRRGRYRINSRKFYFEWKKKKKKKESNTFPSRNLGGIFSRWCSFVETRRKVEENEAREQISRGT